MSVNIELYKIFYAVARNRSFSAAARELFISQPAVSLAIIQLEKQIGSKLFYRTRIGVELSEEGYAIYDYVERAISLLDEADKRLDRLKQLEEGVLRIGASDNICKNYLAHYINYFGNQNSNVKIDVHNGATSRTIKLLKMGKIDLGFVNYPIIDDEVETKPFLYLHDCFVVGEKYREKFKGRKKIEELLSIPLILLEKGTNTRMIFEENMRQLGIKTDPKIEVGSHDMLVMLAKMGLGVACVTEEYVQRELASRDLYKIDININFRPRRLGYCKLIKSSSTFVVKSFIESIEDFKTFCDVDEKKI